MIFLKLATATQSIWRTVAGTDEHSKVELLVVQKGTDHAFLLLEAYICQEETHRAKVERLCGLILLSLCSRPFKPTTLNSICLYSRLVLHVEGGTSLALVHAE